MRSAVNREAVDQLSTEANDPLIFRCMVCAGNQSAPFLEDCADLYLGKPFRVDYRRCVSCALVQQHPTPSEIGVFYDAYPIHAKKSALYSWFRRTLMAQVYQPPRRFDPQALVLDFGCGDGWYLEWCKDSGVKAIGFEYSPQHAMALAERLHMDVMSDMGQLLSRYRGAIDHITLHFVVEHLNEPMRIFDQLSQLLKPGGTIRYVVPNIASWEFRLFRKNWHSLDAPRHLVFPNASHAQRIAKSLGLDYEGETGVTFPNGFGGSLPTALLGRFSAAGLFLTLPLSILLTTLFPSGNMAYLLRRPHSHVA
jgi:SAM-dependent methyltransferase